MSVEHGTSMTESNLTLKDIAVRLFKANAIKFGSFTTQSGAVTPVYFDLRVIVSYPTLLVSKFCLPQDHVVKCAIMLAERLINFIKSTGARTGQRERKNGNGTNQNRSMWSTNHCVASHYISGSSHQYSYDYEKESCQKLWNQGTDWGCLE